VRVPDKKTNLSTRFRRRVGSRKRLAEEQIAKARRERLKAVEDE